MGVGVGDVEVGGLAPGPGVTDGVTGVANAALDCIPMVVIAGDVPSHYYGKHPHQEVNLHSDGSQCEIYRPFCKRVWRVERPEHLPEIMERAFTLAESGQSWLMCLWTYSPER